MIQKENFEPLKIEIPGISLEELQQFVGTAKPHQSRKAAISVIVVTVIVGFIVFRYTMPRSIVGNDKSRLAMISPDSSDPQQFSAQEQTKVQPSSHRIHRHGRVAAHYQLENMSIAANCQPLLPEAGLSPDETFATPALSSDFTSPTLLCANTSAPAISDFGSNATQASYPFYEKQHE